MRWKRSTHQLLPIMDIHKQRQMFTIYVQKYILYSTRTADGGTGHEDSVRHLGPASKVQYGAKWKCNGWPCVVERWREGEGRRRRVCWCQEKKKKKWRQRPTSGATRITICWLWRLSASVQRTSPGRLRSCRIATRWSCSSGNCQIFWSCQPQTRSVSCSNGCGFSPPWWTGPLAPWSRRSNQEHLQDQQPPERARLLYESAAISGSALVLHNPYP